MKNLTLTLALLIGLALNTLAATNIDFKLANGNLVIDNPQTSYTLPVTLRFPQASLNTISSFSFFAQDRQSQIIGAIKKNLLPVTAGYYTINIDTDFNLSPCSEGNCMLSQTFYIMADNSFINTPIQIINPSDLAPKPVTKIVAPANTTDTLYGHPFYDAVTLNGLVLPANQGTIKKIFRHYNILTLKDLQANPFLKDRFATLYNIGTNGFGTTLKNSLASIGDLDVTNIADGLAKFIVARMKEELSTAFFTKFKADLDTPANKPLRTMFPTTYNALKAIDTQIYNYSAYLDLLRESFQKDLALLLPDLQKLSEDETFLAKYPEVKTVLSDAVFIANEFNTGTHPGQILHDYVSTQADSAKLYQINPNIYPSLQTLDLLSQSFRSKYANNYWVTADSLQLLFKNETTIKIYFGLLYQQILAQKGGDIKYNGISLKTFLYNKATHIDSLENIYKPFITNVIIKTKAVDSYFQLIKKTTQISNAPPDYQDYYGLISSSADLIELLETCPLPKGTPPLDTAVVHRMNIYVESIRNVAGIYVDIYYKQYPAAVLALGDLLQNTLASKTVNHYYDNANLLQIKKAAVTAETNATQKARLQISADSIQVIIDTLTKNINKQRAMVALLTKYGNFIATVAKAQNSDDVQNAIEAVAMPSGSSSVKRNSTFNVALNAYIGPYIGSEKIHDFDKHGVTSYGLTAPVGVAVSWGNVFTKGLSLSAFVPLIDLGAIASYRVGNSTTIVGTDTLKTSNIPEVKLKNIVSPGLFLSVGIPHCPISVSGGYQLAPTLRSITAVNSQNQVLDPNTSGLANQYATKMYSRWSISIVVDIPLLNFYTSSK